MALAMKKNYALKSKGDGNYEVTSFTLNSAGSVTDKSIYETTSSSCNCPGFRVRKVCKHQRMVKRIESPGEKVDSTAGAGIVHKVSMALGPFLKAGSFATDEIEKDSDGEIIRIRMSGDVKGKAGTGEKLLKATIDGVPIEVVLK